MTRHTRNKPTAWARLLLAAGGRGRGTMGVWGMTLLTVTLVGASVLMGKKLGAIVWV